MCFFMYARFMGEGKNYPPELTFDRITFDS